MATNLRKILLTEIERLPESKLQEVLNFVRFLRWQPASAVQSQPQNGEPDTTADPLTDFIGAVAHGSLAQYID